MKKKVLAVLLLLAILSTLFVGCGNVITKNKERDANQKVANINYNGLSSAVTKAEVIEAYNSYGFIYTQYYGKTIEETFRLLSDSLANRELLILYARSELAKAKGLDANVEIEKLLTDSEIDAAIKATNETMDKSYKKIIEELEKEDKVSKGITDEDEDADKDDEDKDDEEEKEEELTPRPTRPEDAEPEFDPNKKIDEMTVPFFEQEHTENEFSEKAVKQLKKQLEKNFRSYDYYLNKQYETQLLNSLQRKVTEGYVPSEEEVLAKYNEYIKKNKETFTNTKDAYEEALSKDLSKVVYHPEKGYGYVYNILLKFSDEQTAKLENLKKSGTLDEQYIEGFRDRLAHKITVNVSNLKYDPEYKCEDCEKDKCDVKDCPAKPFVEKDVPVDDILNRMFNSFKAIDDNAELNAYEKFMAKREEATKWIYMVNDDPGMYDSEKDNIISNNELGYLITPEGKDSDFVEEFTKLGRDMIKKGLGTYSVDGTVDGMYCVTDYGIHVMFVSYIPYNTDAVDMDGNKVFDENAEDNLLPLDYIVKYGRYESEATLTKSLRELIYDNILDAYKNDTYSLMTQEVLNEYKGNISNDNKVMDKMIEEIKKEFKVG